MAERHRIIPAVSIFVFHNDKRGQHVLLHRRANTGYRDGWYDTPSGHYEEEDGLLTITAARELVEETCLAAEPDDFELFHVMTNEHETGLPYWYFMFRVPLARCLGNYAIREPDKCDDMHMFPVDDLPENVVPHVRSALEHLGEAAISFSQNN